MGIHTLLRDFLTLSNTHEISNDSIMFSSGTIGSGKFSDNREYSNAKLKDHNFSPQKLYGNKLNCDIFTFSHYWTEHQYASFKGEYTRFKGEYTSQLDSLAGDILEQRKRLKNEGKPHAQSDVFFAVKEFFRSHLLSALFPDKVDKPTPMLGYLPGHMPYELGEELRKLGLTIANKKANDTCHIDRN